MKYFWSLILCLLTMQVFAQANISFIKMQRTACFGRCPEYTIEILKNGNLIYTGKKNVTMLGTYKARISTTAMTKFLKKISKYKISKAESVYHPTASDLPRLNFTFIINGKKKMVKNSESGPNYFPEIALQVDSLIKVLKWKIVPGSSTSATPTASEPPPVKEDDSIEPAYSYVEQMPEFPGGDQAMIKFIQSNIKYPANAKEMGIEGKVIINFRVMQDGSIRGAHVVRGIGGGCDEEALRIVRMMPQWKPGYQNGKAVSTVMNLPISFKIN